MAPIIPFIPLIAAGVTAGTDVGLTLSGAGQPSTPKLSTTPTPLTQGQNLQQQQLISQQFPNIQESAPGVSTGYQLQTALKDAGLLNDPQAAGNAWAAWNQLQNQQGAAAPPLFGQGGLSSSPSATTTGSGSGLPGILDLLSKPSSPGVGTGPSNPAIQNWVQQVLSGNDFRGLAG